MVDFPIRWHLFALSMALACAEAAPAEPETTGRPQSVYARRVDPLPTAADGARDSAPDPASTEGVNPILSSDREYSPPPPWPQESTTNNSPADSSARTSAVRPAAHLAPAEKSPEKSPRLAADDSRRLLSSSTPTGDGLDPAGGKQPQAPQIPLMPMGSVVTTVGAMATVAGLFFLSVYLVRRSLPKSSSLLPDSVVRVLGRKQLAGRQFMQLIRVGNKLVLVSVTPEGTEPLTEVTDPAEVDRLLGLCHEGDHESTTAAFQEVMAGLSREDSSASFLGAETSPAGSGRTFGPPLGSLGGQKHG